MTPITDHYELGNDIVKALCLRSLTQVGIKGTTKLLQEIQVQGQEKIVEGLALRMCLYSFYQVGSL
jgi:hypothetical protein